VIAALVGILLLAIAGAPALAQQAAGEQPSTASSGEGATSASAASGDEESIFEKLIVDPYNKRYGHPPGKGWIPIPRTRTELRFGGFVQLNVIHDFEDTGFDFGDFIPSQIPVPTDDTPDTQFDPRTTRVTFETRTDTEEAGAVRTMISMDFAGDESENSIQPRLRQAYVTWVGPLSHMSYTAGQTWTTFMDLGVWPEIFDLEGPNGMTGLRQGLLRGGYAFGDKKKLVFEFSLEQPETFVENGLGSRDWPDLATRLSWQPEWGHLQVATVVRQLVAESTSGTGRDAALGWGGSFSGNWLVPGTKREKAPTDDLGSRQDNIQFQVQAGSGVGRYVFDLGAAPTPQDAVYDDGSMKTRPLDEVGGFLAYHHWWGDRWRSEVLYGVVDVDNLTIQPATALKRTTYALANVLYRPFRRMDAGLEYYRGERENADGETGDAHRIMLTVNFGF